MDEEWYLLQQVYEAGIPAVPRMPCYRHGLSCFNLATQEWPY